MILEKRCEAQKSTIVCSQREPKPTGDEMVKISKQIDATGEGNWLGVIQGLQKGQCIVVGDRMLSNGKVGAVSPVVTSITSFQNRI